MDKKAQAGELPETVRVEGAAEVPGTRSGDYRFVKPDANRISADLIQPQVAEGSKIVQKVIDKGNQAEIVVVELGQGNSGQVGVNEAVRVAQDVFSTPDHGVNRVIFIKDGKIIVDYSR
ncbi:hypothetical protein AB0758_24170 [Tolypothrix bouteillei VB521301_2]|uniref:tRNA nuclease CdiA C-terminal domain-containing protein n=1 Tax=Tolypothrix bouteillei VB521301 TaxID=1479485 RepID=A0A0C1N280_9CYAN